MSWIITHDYTVAPANRESGAGRDILDNPCSYQNAVGLCGPAKEQGGWRMNCTVLRFRMYDDDGELYYEGLATRNDREDGFEPLDDFGLPNAGCTVIKYQDRVTGEWEVL